MDNITRRQALTIACAGGTIFAVGSDTRASAADDDDQIRKLLKSQRKVDTQNWDAEKSLWLRQLVLDLKAIKVGTTRSDLDKLLVSDGPTLTPKAHRYQHPKCPFIKLDVFFDVENDIATARPDDTVSRVEGPLIDLVSNWQRF